MKLKKMTNQYNQRKIKPGDKNILTLFGICRLALLTVGTFNKYSKEESRVINITKKATKPKQSYSFV